MEWTYDCQPSIIWTKELQRIASNFTFPLIIVSPRCLSILVKCLVKTSSISKLWEPLLPLSDPTHQPLHPQLKLNLNWKSPQRDWILKHSEKCRMKVAKRLDLIKTAFYVWARAEMPLSRRCHYATQRGEQKTKVLRWNICNVPFVRSQTAFIVERIGKLFGIVFQLCCITFQLHLEMSDSFQQKQKDKIQVTEKNISFKYLWGVQNHNEKKWNSIFFTRAKI